MGDAVGRHAETEGDPTLAIAGKLSSRKMSSFAIVGTFTARKLLDFTIVWHVCRQNIGLCDLWEVFQTKKNDLSFC